MPFSHLTANIATKLEGRQSALFAVCVVTGALHDECQRIREKLPQHEADRLTRFECPPNEPLSPEVVSAWITGQFQSSMRSSLLCVFDARTSNDARAIAKGVRNFGTSHQSPCVVLVGAWNILRVIHDWGAQGSAFEAAEVMFCEGLSPSAIEIKFNGHCPPDSVQRTAFLELIRQETSGYEWLCDGLLAQLNAHPSTDVAVALRGLHESPSIERMVQKRFLDLTQTQQNLLNQLLDRRILAIPDGKKDLMCDAFDLWLQGFARFRERPGLRWTAFHLLPPAPVIERCLRPASTLILASPAISSSIQPLVYEFENALRDFASSIMRAHYGDEWARTELSKLSGKHAAHKDETSDMSVLVKSLVDERLAEQGMTKTISTGQEPAADPDSHLFKVITDAQRHLVSLPANPTTGTSPLSFLTFADLIQVLTDKKWFSACFRPIFNLESAVLRSKLEDIKQIRNAVAHHYPLKFSQLVNAQSLIRELLDRMALRV